jgi:hypothetical protein
VPGAGIERPSNHGAFIHFVRKKCVNLSDMLRYIA